MATPPLQENKAPTIILQLRTLDLSDGKTAYKRDRDVSRLQFALYEHARLTSCKIKQEKKGKRAYSDEDRIRLEALSMLKKLPYLVSRHVRENADFFSSDKNALLEADKAMVMLVDLLSLTRDQKQPNFTEECRKYGNILKALANNPALLEDTNYTSNAVVCAVAIFLTLALMVAFLSVTPVLNAGAFLLLSTLVLAVITEIFGLLNAVSEANDAYETVEYFKQGLLAEPPSSVPSTPKQPVPAEPGGANLSFNGSFFANLPRNGFQRVPGIAALIPGNFPAPTGF